MARKDTVTLFHPGGSRVDLDEDHKVRIDLLRSRGYTDTAPAKPAPVAPVLPARR